MAKPRMMFLESTADFEMPFDPDEKDRRFDAKGD